MPPVDAPALEKPENKVADVLPESVKLPEVKSDYGASEFWKDEEAPAPKVAEPAKVDPVQEPETKVPTLVDRLAAKTKPVEAAPAPKVEVPKIDNPEDKLALDPKSSPKARENFENLRTITKGLRDQLIAKDREISEAKAKPVVAAGAVDHAETERLKAENKAMSDKLLLIDTKNHPVFQNQYVAPRKEALAAATELLKANGKDADLAALIEKPRGEIGKALQEILKDVPSFDQSEISANVQKAYQLAQSEKSALANAEQVNGAIQKHDSATYSKAFDATWNKVVGDVTDILQPVDIPAGVPATARAAIEEYNKAMGSLQSNARQIATGAATHESIADASIRAAAYDLHVKHVLPRIGVEIAEMQGVIRGLTKEVEGYRSRNPNKEISPSPGGGSNKGTPVSIEQAADQAWGGKG